jgi:hypothetical protein
VVRDRMFSMFCFWARTCRAAASGSGNTGQGWGEAGRA